MADPDTLDRLSRLCGEIWLRRHSWTRHEDGRRARTAAYEPVQVLPPELLRMLPEWRALVVRGNLSPVVVRLGMAWRRQGYRHVRRVAGASPLSLPTTEEYRRALANANPEKMSDFNKPPSTRISAAST